MYRFLVLVFSLFNYVESRSYTKFNGVRPLDTSNWGPAQAGLGINEFTGVCSADSPDCAAEKIQSILDDFEG